jgi:uncharacterized damage-inducible protein DinB
MKATKWLLLCLLGVVSSGVSWAQAGNAEARHTVSQIEDHLVTMAEGEFVPAADAMPENKYSFAPTDGDFKGVRTFAQQVKHVAAVNYLIGSAILEEKSPVDMGGESGPDSMTSKADIMKYLKDSFAYLHKAAASINEKNQTDEIKAPFGSGKVSKLGIMTIALWHPFDHYGQMVEYLRMNGIVPPASRH